MFDDDDLREHEPFLRGLARSLTSDRHLAEDLVQETLLYALRRAPEDLKSPRAWLRQVLRNKAINAERSADRRLRRETLAARDRDEGSAEADIETVREIVGAAIARLPESQRSVVERYYLEAQDVRSVAKATGRSVDSVKSQLKRARLTLRRDLEERHGKKFTTLVLLPFLQRRESRPRGHRAGAVLAAGLAAVVAATLWIWSERFAPTRAAAATRDEKSISSGDDLVNAPSNEGRAVLVARDAASSPAAPDGRTPEARFRVLDTRGQPVEGAVLRMLRDTPRVSSNGRVVGSELLPSAISGADGYGATAACRPGDRLFADDAEWTTVIAGIAWNTRGDDYVADVVVGHPQVLHGIVVDEHERPVADARVSLYQGTGIGVHARVSSDVIRVARTGGDGTYSIPGVSDPRGHIIVAEKAGYSPTPEAAATDGMRLALTPAEARISAPGTEWIRGRVVDEDGVGVPGATVSIGYTTQTNSRGEFVLPLFERTESTPGHTYYERRSVLYLANRLPEGIGRVWATAQGRMPASTPFTPGATDLVLRLGPAPNVLRGSVVDAGGKPVEDAEVWVEDPTFLQLTEYPWAVETAARGEARWEPTRTDADGRFSLGGLLARPYTVAVHPHSTAHVTRVVCDPTATGPLEIRLLPHRPPRRLEGRVVHPDGAPADGATVLLVFVRRTLSTADGRAVREHRFPTQHVLAGEDGRFSVLVTREQRLAIQSLEGIYTEVAVDDLVSGAPVIVPRRVYLTMSEPGRSAYSHYTARDSDGRLLPLYRKSYEHVANLPRFAEQSRIRGAFVSAEVAELHLVRWNGEVEQRSVTIAPGATYEIYP